jgi:hypothetical protein
VIRQAVTPDKLATSRTATEWRNEWFEIEDATYLNTAAHAAIPRIALRAVQTSKPISFHITWMTQSSSKCQSGFVSPSRK